MFRTIIIDWMSFTNRGPNRATDYVLPSWENARDAKPDVPRFGYHKAVRFTSGLVIMYDGATATMGSHYIYSGQALANLNEYFQDGGISILRWHTRNGHVCTRIDLAIDVMSEPLFLPQIKSKAERNDFSGTARSATIVSSSDGLGLTVYIGSRSSERFVRIYNKAAQTGEPGDWARIEAEVKHDSARTIARAIVEYGDSGLSLVGKSVIRRICEFDCTTWQAVFAGATIPVGTPKVEEKKTEEWLLGQVATALAKFERAYPEKKILERLWETVEDMLGE